MEDYESLSSLDFCPRTLMFKECNTRWFMIHIFNLFPKVGVNKLEISNFPNILLVDQNKSIGVLGNNLDPIEVAQLGQ